MNIWGVKVPSNVALNRILTMDNLWKRNMMIVD
jgi:hypothetical protein